jgi:hypothetical protein
MLSLTGPHVIHDLVCYFLQTKDGVLGLCEIGLPEQIRYGFVLQVCKVGSLFRKANVDGIPSLITQRFNIIVSGGYAVILFGEILSQLRTASYDKVAHCAMEDR